jgi:uncharacterized protein (TIGR02996 family)
MTSEKAFLSEIVAHPEDDAARLVYADWLDENGGPDRAEFIRAQIRLDDMPEWEPERLDLEERSLDLLAGRRGEWLSHLPKWARPMRLSFRRGFVAEAEVSPASFLEHGERLAKLVPLEAVRLVGATRRCGELARSPGLAKITELDLSRCELRAAGYAEFFDELRADRLRKWRDRGAGVARWQGLARVTDLDFPNAGEATLLTVLASGSLGPLESLDLHNTQLTRRALAPLVACERLTGLRRLRFMLDGRAGESPAEFAKAHWPRLEELRFNPFGSNKAEGCRAFLAAPWAAGLKALELSSLRDTVSYLLRADPAGIARFAIDYSDFDADQAARLGAADCARSLRELRVTACEVGDETVEVLARSPGLANLSRLQIQHVGDLYPSITGMAALLGSVHLGSLRDLSVSCWIPGADGRRLAGHPGLARLTVLGLRGCLLGAAEAAALAGSRHLRIARLDLSRNALRDEGVKALLRARWLPSLRELDLSFNGFGDQGAEALAACEGLSRLRTLELWGNSIGDDGAALLAASPHLGRLLRLTLHSRDLSAAGRDRLLERFGSALELA